MKPPRKDVYGYFDSVDQSVPSHDPGISGLCPVCANPVGSHSQDNPLQTISICLQDLALRDKSWFFRVHKNCWERSTPHYKSLVESACIDNSI